VTLPPSLGKGLELPMMRRKNGVRYPTNSLQIDVPSKTDLSYMGSVILYFNCKRD
jgi:hypothetical protein